MFAGQHSAQQRRPNRRHADPDKGTRCRDLFSGLQEGALPSDAYAELIASTTRLNSIGTELAGDPDVHAVTDVTGFGVLGHALEMARGSQKLLSLKAGNFALFSRCAELAEQGFVTGASDRNWASYATEVSLPDALPMWQRHILTDPQTSGGLLVSCSAHRAQDLLHHIVAAGYPPPGLLVRSRTANLEFASLPECRSIFWSIGLLQQRNKSARSSGA